MEVVHQVKQKILELDKRFFLILENFLDNYIGYLKTPQNTLYANEMTHINTVLNNIEQDEFLLKNKIDVQMTHNKKQLELTNNKIDKLKTDNNTLKQRAINIHTDAMTSEGLYDNELTLYIDQLKTIVIMFIGLLIGLKVIIDMNLNQKQAIFSIIVVFIIGSLIQKYSGM